MMLFIQRIVIPVVSILAVVILFFHALAAQNIILLFLLAAFPLLCFLAQRSFIWFGAIIFSGLASIIMPGISQTLMLREVLAFGFICFAFLPFFLGKLPFPAEFKLTRFFAVAFIAILLLHMFMRGTGLRSLGGASFGGMNYIRAILAAGILLVAGSIHGNVQSWKRLVVVYLIGLTIPGIAQSIFLLSDGAIYQQYYVIGFDETSMFESLRASLMENGVVRYQALQGMSQAIIMLAMTLAPWSLMVPLFFLSIPPVFLSGFRSALVFNLALLFLFSFLFWQKHRFRTFLKYISVIILLGALPYPFSLLLPASAQRVLSMVPVYAISDTARDAASSTIDWRLEIWRMMLTSVPDYLWIGKGFAFESSLYSSVDPYFLTTPEYAFDTHNYHNGPLAILLDLGIGGLLCVLGLFAASLRELMIIRRRLQANTTIHRIFTFFLALYILQVVTYLCVHGDITVSLPNMMYTLAIMIALHQSSAVGTIEPDTGIGPVAPADVEESA